jgi:hypothetical protein
MTGTFAVDILIAVVIGLIIWRVSMRVVNMLSTPPPELDPSDVVEVDQDYKCSVCGAELTMKAVNIQEDKPPRHCREEMDPVWRPG